MRVVVIGAVAAGTSAAAKARRNDEDCEIVIYEKDSFISYSGCGMPYYLSGELLEKEELYPRDEEFFKKKYNILVKTLHEVLKIDPDKKTLRIKNLKNGEEFTDYYDKLVIATGASVAIPNILGVDRKNVFTFRNINDLNKVLNFINEKKPKKAAIIGTGYVGLELCESLTKAGLKVSLISRKPYLTNILDHDLSLYVEEYITKKGVDVLKNKKVVEIEEEKIVFDDGSFLESDFVILATGVRPNTNLAKDSNIKLGVNDAIIVDEKMQTNIKDIYACGDCIALNHLVSNKKVYKPLGSTANKTGRLAGHNLTGGNSSFEGVLGTGIFRVFDMTVGVTGLRESEAKELGFELEVCIDTKVDRPEYLGGNEMVTKAIACKKTGRLLGVQIVGFGGVDKRIDVFVTALTFKAKVSDLVNLDLAYSPPFSTTKDPVMYIGMILENAISKSNPLISPHELKSLMESGSEISIIDARDEKYYKDEHIMGAKNIPLQNLRKEVKNLNKKLTTISYCNKGRTGNSAQNILKNCGFSSVYNLSGGIKHFNKVNDIDKKH